MILNNVRTDKELFESLDLGDVWPEAELVQVWFYLYRNSHLRIPDSWSNTMEKFNELMLDAV